MSPVINWPRPLTMSPIAMNGKLTPSTKGSCQVMRRRGSPIPIWQWLFASQPGVIVYVNDLPSA